MRITQRKGDIATSQAIATFTKLGYDVSVPITESAKYDLIVDDGNGVYRVQVKYSSIRDIGLRNVHSNTKGIVTKKALPNDYDWLYALYVPSDGEPQEYLFKQCFVNRRAVAINENFRLR